ncbi:MAG: penicillin acylase family protein [Pseudomonadota bacterium]
MNWAHLAFGAVLGKRLPKIDGQIRVGSRSDICVQRDAYGVAYIDAKDEADAWFGLGFCHGQDRAGQLEILLRLVRGTLSEVVGPETLPVDRAVRQIGMRRAASAQLPTLDADVRDQLAQYATGLNAALESPSARRSHEHALLRIRPTPWEPADIVGLGLLTCCFLPSNWDVELARLILLEQDGADAVLALDPTFRQELPLTSPPGQPAGPAREFVAGDLEALRAFIGHSGGSNAWAVSGARAAEGRPLLANDPHLPAALPNFGYLARVRCPAFAVAGVSIVGIPAFITGHNGHAAWGSTAAQVDNVDLFLEELSEDGERVREGDQFVACSAHSEQIAVKGQAAVELRVRTTARGPIVARTSDPEASIFNPMRLPGRANALSFAATWLQKRPTRALLGFHKVKSFAEFRQACAASAGCGYSLIYADSASIGWLLATEVPKRKTGFGSVPLPGWSKEVGWESEIIASDALPWLENPSAGFVSCANNQPVADSTGGAFLGHDFLDGYRQARISERLAEHSAWTVTQMLELQTDLVSLPFREVQSVLLGLVPSDESAGRALELLRAWDGRMSSDSAAATVYALFVGELCQRACEAKAPNSWRTAAGQGVMKLIPGTCWNARRASFVARLIAQQPPGYFSSWPGEMSQILSHVVRDLEQRFGTEDQAWAWGKVRPLPVKHRLGENKVLGAIFNLEPLPGYGDGTTVDQAGFEFWKPLRHSTVVAHLRSVIDIGNFGASRFTLLGGQSGNPLSPHYADLIPVWQRGDGIPIHWDEQAVARYAMHTLELTASTSQPRATTPRA